MLRDLTGSSRERQELLAAQIRLNERETENAPSSVLRLWRSFLGWVLALLFCWEVPVRLLLLPLLLRDCAFAAPAQDNPDEEKIWRVIYVEGGPFSDYQRIFQGLALGLEERGLIENGHVPLPKDSEEARGMWEWLHQHAGGSSPSVTLSQMLRQGNS